MVPHSSLRCQDRSIDQQYDRIKSLTDALESRFHAGQPANRNLVSLLNALAAQLHIHFEWESQRSAYETLTPQAQQLRDQQQALAREAAELVKLGRDTFTQHGDTEKLAKRFHRFHAKLSAHERAESELRHTLRKD